MLSCPRILTLSRRTRHSRNWRSCGYVMRRWNGRGARVLGATGQIRTVEIRRVKQMGVPGSGRQFAESAHARTPVRTAAQWAIGGWTIGRACGDLESIDRPSRPVHDGIARVAHTRLEFNLDACSFRCDASDCPYVTPLTGPAPCQRMLVTSWRRCGKRAS
jgi:hypothetical protein